MKPETEKLVIKLLGCLAVIGLGMMCCSGLSIGFHFLSRVLG